MSKGGMTIIDHRIVDSMITENRKDLDNFNMILELEMTPNPMMLVDLNMKMENLVDHWC